MSRRRKITQTDLLQPSQGAPPPPATTTAAPESEPSVMAPPRLLEFTPLTSGERWRVERFDELAAQFHFKPVYEQAWAKQMAWFQEFAQRHTRAWLIVRRLYGVAALIPSAETHPDELRLWTRPELEAEGFLVQPELDALTALWSASMEREQRTSIEQAPPPPPAPEANRGELALDDTLLERFGFSEKMFDMMVWSPTAGEQGRGAEVPRPAEERRREREWFIKQVKHWEKMLDDPQGGPVARAALRNMLYLERIANEMGQISPTQTKWERLNDQQARLSKAYQGQLDELQVMFPEMSVAGKVSFRGMMSDMNLLHRHYYGYKDRRLLDKVFTATEVEFQLRTSVQLPTPRYRLGLSLAIIEAQAGLYDPEFRSQLKPHVLKQLTAGFTAAVQQARDLDQPVVDLEKGVLPGEGDDFEDFLESEKKDGDGQ